MSILAHWYFDVISPYSYLQLADMDRLPMHVEVEPIPVFLGALLKHSGTKGPAEIPAKRLHTYRQCTWLAHKRQIPFCMPPRHPFSPLGALRLLCSLGPTLEQARLASTFVFGQGNDPSTPDGLGKLAEILGLPSSEAAAAQANKEKLRANTETALARGVWGVPTFVINNELFWGADTFPMLLEFLSNPQILQVPDMKRLETLPYGLQ